MCSYQKLVSRSILEFVPCNSILTHVQVKENEAFWISLVFFVSFSWKMDFTLFAHVLFGVYLEWLGKDILLLDTCKEPASTCVFYTSVVLLGPRKSIEPFPNSSATDYGLTLTERQPAFQVIQTQAFPRNWHHPLSTPDLKIQSNCQNPQMLTFPYGKFSLYYIFKFSFSYFPFDI